MSIPPSDYQILVKQMFRCKGVADYACPMLMRTFDRSGYHVTNNSALCPSCYAVSRQVALQSQASVRQGNRVQARQRIIHFLHTAKWTVGNGEFTLAWKDFWGEFYRWSEEQRLYTKKSLVRSVLAEMCSVAHDTSHLPITPV
jgi:hypothetical protein